MAKKKTSSCSKCRAPMWPDARGALVRICRKCRAAGSESCGSQTGWHRHRRIGDQPCEPCRLAWNAYCKQMKSRHRASVARPGECSKCGKGLQRVTLDSPMCAECRGMRPGRHLRITRASRLAIYKRDDWTCQICLDPVDPEVPANSRWGATLDHIIPWSRGGSDDPANLRLAHRWCNSVRGDLSHYTDDDLRVA